MTPIPDNLEAMHDLHGKWLNGEPDGKQLSLPMGADLSCLNLTGWNLSHAILPNANFAEANLTDANLSDAELSEAYFAGATLARCKFTRSQMRKAYFSGANLHHATFAHANLRFAYFSLANCYKAHFRGADLTNAFFGHSNLRGANFFGTKLAHSVFTFANLESARINWTSLSMIAEILHRAAGDDVSRLALVGYFYFSREVNWKSTFDTGHPLHEWALDTMAKYVRSGDGAPPILAARVHPLQALENQLEGQTHIVLDVPTGCGKSNVKIESGV